MSTDLTVKSLDGKGMITIDNVRSIPSFPIGKECTATKADTSRFNHLKGISLSSMNESICLLIGSNTPEAFYELDERRGKTTEPRAIKTALGWTIQGPSGKKSTNSNVLINFVSSQKPDAKATQTLKLKLSDSMEPHEEEYGKEHKEYDETILTDRCTHTCARRFRRMTNRQFGSVRSARCAQDLPNARPEHRKTGTRFGRRR